jgi:hypothetical protein
MAALAVGLLASTAPDDAGPAGSLVHFDLLRGTVRHLAPKPRAGCPSCRNFGLGPP